MNKIILITICLSSVTLSQISADYQYSFIFSDEFNNSEELFLGKDPFGSDGIDTLFANGLLLSCCKHRDHANC